MRVAQAGVDLETVDPGHVREIIGAMGGRRQPVFPFGGAGHCADAPEEGAAQAPRTFVSFA